MIRRSITAVVILSFVVAACGGDDRDSAPTSTESSDDGSASPTTESQPTGSTDAPTTTEGSAASTVPADEQSGEPGTTVAEEPPVLEPGQFGTMAAPVCGPGDASGATDQGVTDESITIGTLSDAGNTIIPGLLQEMFDAADAFVAWCNAAGGINGRPINLIKRDTKLLEGPARIAESCAEDFMLVGGAAGIDGAIVEPRLECNLPQIAAFVNDPAAKAAGLQVVTTGTDPDLLDAGLYRLVAEAYPEQAEHFGYVAADTRGTGRPVIERIPMALEQVGFTTVYTQATPPPPATVDNWRPYLEPALAAGVRMFEFNQTAEQTVAMMNSFADVGFHPEVMTGNTSQYSSVLVDGNDVIDEIDYFVGIFQYPFESAGDYAPMQQFLDIMDAELPGWSADPQNLTVLGFNAWLMWAQAASGCGSDLTRDCVMAAASNLDEWDAGGIMAPFATADGKPVGPSCVAVVQATSDGFVYREDITQPNTGVFNCDDRNRLDAPA